MVAWTEVAKADLRNIHEFIAHESKFYAKKVVQDIVEKTDVLDSHRFIGRVVAEFKDESIREISMYAYRIIYQLLDEKVFVLTIVHKRQKLKKIKNSSK